MKLINTLSRYLSCFLLIIAPLSGKEDHRVENQPLALDMALTLPQHGVLKQKDNGFVYLDLQNEFITQVASLLEYEGRLSVLPTAARSLGAHISVFNENENITPEELGNTFTFQVKEIRSFTNHTRDGLKKQWVIAVDCPDLEQLREHYGCTPKLKGHDYHITLGKQLPAAPDDWERIETLSPFNFSDEDTAGLSEKGDFVTVDSKQLLSTAQKVNAIGQLKLKSNGFVYLDVSNEFVDGIWPQLPTKKVFEPISTKPKKMGAHISVIHEDEMIGKEIWNLKEAGQWFGFEVKELRYVDRKTASGLKRLWLLAADAPALERLRTHYGLKPKLQGHDFHITIGEELLESSLRLEKDSQAA